jgi:serine/threonine-protein kinase
VAIIYRALDSDDKVVALKVLFPPAGITEDSIKARFEREAQIAASLRHSNIVPVLDTGQDRGHVYLVMPLIDGDTLEERLKRKGSLDELTSLDIAWQIANALDYAHQQGIVHRDIKPSNVLLTKDNQALLTDFGVVQALDAPSLTQSGHIIGTPAYMAPEQAIEEKVVDRRADLYSLGVILYRMVTGRLPFRGSTAEMLHAHVYEQPPTPSSITRVSPGMEAIILRAMAKNPVDRYQDGAAMAQALSRLDYKLRNEAQQIGWWQSIVRRLKVSSF